ncbi:MAG: V-type ATP synthase subunit K [Candidatus Thermoplasmatota archaeon]|nr:V-type ATP synthase subunit K [Candidatus Thermoplasmatota archaeon]
MKGLSALFVLFVVAAFATGVQAQEDAHEEATEDNTAGYAALGAGLALGLAGIGTGLSQGPIGAASVGMIAEDKNRLGHAILFTALPETIVLFGFLAMFLMPGLA